MRVYLGSETQLPDPLIEAKQGFGKAPAYRGMAYVVLEDFPLESFGNRIPQLSFEVIRPVGKLEPQIEAITIIPGASEYAYSPVEITDQIGPRNTVSLNRHVLHASSDWEASINELQALCPNLKRVALVVSWFGTDLRASQCSIEPRVEVAARPGASQPWVVSGLQRAQANLVSTVQGGPAFGGTPSDASVLAAIADLKNRGLQVTLYPFMMMDIPAGNGLPDPYGAAQQAVYPWRGRITDVTDQTSALPSAVASFVGSVGAGDFWFSGSTVHCNSNELSYRRLILHYAHLCAAAGGVDAFIIGSELRGLTRLRDHNGGFPFVQSLRTLAAECRSILGGATGITYAADWSEYFGYQPTDGSGDVFFNLDPLWADPSITSVGIDNYMPLSDWRGTRDSARLDDARSAYDASSMSAAITAGEGFDWYYASAADRAAELRTPIASGDRGDSWLYRYKDLQGWWTNPHYDRRNGVAVTNPSPWVPASKPIWFTELGAPAVDVAANQPNVFPDPKSSENAVPYQSLGGRDDLAQRRFLEAHLAHWASRNDGMVPTDRIYLWTWDARPQPAFPVQSHIWSDGGNWHLGHWLTGRLGAAPADDLMAHLAADYGLSNIDASQSDGIVDGLLLNGDHTARSVIEALSDLWKLTATQHGDTLCIASADWRAVPRQLTSDDLVEDDGEPVVTRERLDESELPGRLDFSFSDTFLSYEAASVSAFRGEAGLGTENLSLSVSLSEGVAQQHAASVLRARWEGRETVNFALPPEYQGVTAQDRLSLEGTEYSVFEIEQGDAIRITARSSNRLASNPPVQKPEGKALGVPQAISGAPDVALLDLPALPGTDKSTFAAASVRQWRGSYGFYFSLTDDGFALRATASRYAVAGRLVDPLAPGLAWRWQPHQSVLVDLVQGQLSSLSPLEVLSGDNVVAIETAVGWEIVQFQDATLVGDHRYRLSNLLRGQNGTEAEMAAGAAAGARLVLLDAALVGLDLETSERGVELNWRVVRTGEFISSPNAVSLAFSGGLRSLVPLSPVHLRRSGSVFSWVRRDRVDADAWDQSDIPMSERSETYELSLTDASSGHLFHSATVPHSHFDASSLEPVPNSLELQVAQVSAITGPGFAASRTFQT
ncbi:MAG: glycoside hydrolase/phage tail family protein [Pseudomonadota bacterium]